MNAMPMIARCIRAQWYGLPLGLRDLLRSGPGLCGTIGVLSEQEYLLWHALPREYQQYPTPQEKFISIKLSPSTLDIEGHLRPWDTTVTSKGKEIQRHD